MRYHNLLKVIGKKSAQLVAFVRCDNRSKSLFSDKEHLLRSFINWIVIGISFYFTRLLPGIAINLFHFRQKKMLQYSHLIELSKVNINLDCCRFRISHRLSLLIKTMCTRDKKICCTCAMFVSCVVYKTTGSVNPANIPS